MQKSTLLIVEDNAEVRDFLRSCLTDDYEILEAPDGCKGFELAVQELPDLIITDIMMPEVDGVEYTKNIKKDQRTSHVPVIMLTAKDGIESQVEGVDSGADVYLTKPFSIKVLRSYIKNILRSKESLRQHYSEKILVEPLNIEIGSVDKQFMQRLLEVIDKKLSDPDFRIPELSKEIGMSTAVLYKKFNALTHTPVAEFIKALRLKKAALLLEHDKMNISEVTWEVGFNDRKYFSKEFKKFYGINPSEYAAAKRNQA